MVVSSEKQLFKRPPQTAAMFHEVLSSLWTHVPSQAKKATPGVVPDSGTYCTRFRPCGATPYEEVLASREAAEWKLTLKEELAFLKQMTPGPWKSNLLESSQVLNWVFQVKSNVAGNVERYKARLVAKRFMQRKRLLY